MRETAVAGENSRGIGEAAMGLAVTGARQGFKNAQRDCSARRTWVDNRTNKTLALRVGFVVERGDKPVV